MFDTVCAVFLIWNVSGVCNRKLFLCHKYHRGKHGAIPQEGDASKNPITLSFQTISRVLRASRWNGGTSHAVVHASKEHTGFFPSCPVVWWSRKKGAAFVVLLFDIFQTMSDWPSPLLWLKHLLLVVVYRIEVLGSTVREPGFHRVSNRAAQKKYINSRRLHT